jgi:hypothetical protein
MPGERALWRLSAPRTTVKKNYKPTKCDEEDLAIDHLISSLTDLVFRNVTIKTTEDPHQGLEHPQPSL